MPFRITVVVLTVSVFFGLARATYDSQFDALSEWRLADFEDDGLSREGHVPPVDEDPLLKYLSENYEEADNYQPNDLMNAFKFYETQESATVSRDSPELSSHNNEQRQKASQKVKLPAKRRQTPKKDADEPISNNFVENSINLWAEGSDLSLVQRELQMIQNLDSLLPEKQEYIKLARAETPNISNSSLATLVCALCYFSAIKTDVDLPYVWFRLGVRDISFLAGKLGWREQNVIDFYQRYLLLLGFDFQPSKEYKFRAVRHLACAGNHIPERGSYKNLGIRREAEHMFSKNPRFLSQLEKIMVLCDPNQYRKTRKREPLGLDHIVIANTPVDFNRQRSRTDIHSFTIDTHIPPLINVQDIITQTQDGERKSRRVASKRQLMGYGDPESDDEQDYPDVKRQQLTTGTRSSGNIDKGKKPQEDMKSLVEEEMDWFEHPEQAHATKITYFVYAQTAFPNLAPYEICAFTAAICYKTTWNPPKFMFRISRTELDLLATSMNKTVDVVVEYFQWYLRNLGIRFSPEAKHILHDHPACEGNTIPPTHAHEVVHYRRKITDVFDKDGSNLVSKWRRHLQRVQEFSSRLGEGRCGDEIMKLEPTACRYPEY